MQHWDTVVIRRRCWKNCRRKGHIYGLDVDPIESAKTKKRLEEKGFGPDILTVKLENFANIDKVAEEAGKFDFVLADLGVSSMQIDNPDRGFTFKAEGPLDLRMNPEKESAQQKDCRIFQRRAYQHVD